MRRSFLHFVSTVLAGFQLMAAEETAVVTEHRINVRGQPSLVGEVVTQLDRGAKVVVLERIRAEKPKPGEPTNWARIRLPEKTPVWVFAPFIKDGKVTATRLNVRAGPGENYSVLGRLSKGTEVKAIRVVEEWMEIEAPPDAYAFVDASLIQAAEGQAASAVAAAAPTAESKPPETPVPAATPPPTPAAESTPPVDAAPPPTVAAPRTTAAAATEQQRLTPDALAAPATSAPPPTESAQPPAAVQPAVPALPESLPRVAEPLERKPEPPAQKRIVRREGIIRATRSIQAPTWYELVHPETKKTINYLYEEKLGVKLKDYKGKRVVVTGEEGIDPRWPNTPIIEIETLDIAP